MKTVMPTVFSRSLGLVSTASSLAVFARLPNVMPIHWSIAGTANGFAPTIIAAFLIPAMLLALPAFFSLAARLDPRRENVVRSQSAFDVAQYAIAISLCATHLAILAANLGLTINMGRLAFICLGLLLTGAGNVLGKTRSNFSLGIRTRWTLSSEPVWDHTNRAGGRSLLLAGLGLTWMAALPTIGVAHVLGALGALLVLFIGLTVYSHRLFKRFAKDEMGATQ